MLTIGLIAVCGLFQGGSSGPAVDPGSLQIIGADGRPGISCPLKGTQVGAQIDGFGARVIVVQTFSNPGDKPIEALYRFPLPADSAVDGMRMIIGNRVIEGVIKRKQEARETYEKAKKEGKSTALLDQERPNIFTQSVANIPPHAQIKVALTYVQILTFEKGEFEFVYPMVVGPRYTGPTTPDPNHVVVPIVPKGMRSGSTITLNVDLDAGAPITEMHSVLHKIDVQRRGESQAHVELARADEIPNRDFILRYSISQDTIVDSFLTTADPKKGGFFTLILMPPKVPKADQIAAKEAIFVMDQSGSQNGFPIEKSKVLTVKAIQALNPNDTFNVVSFSNDFRRLWESPRKNTAANRAQAVAYIQGLSANGGTELEKAVIAALSPPPDPARPRIVVFNTDGFIGGEAQALTEIQRHRGNARMFTFGIGNSVNRYLIEAMAAEGRGDYEVVTLNADADAAVERLVQRTDNPVLTDISVEFEGVQTHDLLPRHIPDVFGEHPVIVKGRYDRPGKGFVTVTGKLGGHAWQRRYPITFPSTGNSGSAIASLWAREKVNDLGLQQREESVWHQTDHPHDAKYWEDAITNLALEFSIMSQYTSFVAVDRNIVNPGGKQETVQVPVDMADGVSYDRIFGSGGGSMAVKMTGQGDPRLAPAPSAPMYGGGDPLLSVDAPADAIRVVAVFPEGDVKPLVWNPKSARWEVRFDIPASFKEGTYTVKVYVLNKDGSRKAILAPFKVALTAPDLHPTSVLLADGRLRLSIPGDPRWARVALLTPSGERLDLAFDLATGTIRVDWPLVRDFAGGWFTLIGMDRAHNEARIRLFVDAHGRIEKIEPVS